VDREAILQKFCRLKAKKPSRHACLLSCVLSWWSGGVGVVVNTQQPHWFVCRRGKGQPWSITTATTTAIDRHASNMPPQAPSHKSHRKHRTSQLLFSVQGQSASLDYADPIERWPPFQVDASSHHVIRREPGSKARCWYSEMQRMLLSIPASLFL
jgi:hypothetical protein